MGTRGRKHINDSCGKDHPHACGDKIQYVLRLLLTHGSSPRVWGQVIFILTFSPASGIIPTRVGTSVKTQSTLVSVQDHPHACGDKVDNIRYVNASAGSSPRVWGQVTYRTQSKSTKRIIPTRVGTSVRLAQNISFTTDHPHACGDKCRYQCCLSH